MRKWPLPFDSTDPTYVRRSSVDCRPRTPWHLVTSLFSAEPAISPSANCCPRSICATATASSPPSTRIIAASRAGLDEAGYRDKVRGELGRFVAADALDDETVHRFLARLQYASIDFADASDWRQLTALLPADPGKVRVYYLACAPSLFGPISEHLACPPPGRRIVAGGPGEADRPGPGLGTSHQRRGRSGLRGIPDLPHRPLPGQGERAEPARHPVRQHLPGTAVELELDRPRPDHRVGVARRGHPRRVLRQLRRVARHGAEPSAAGAVPGRHGTPDLRRPGNRPRRETQGAAGTQADDARRRRALHRRGPVRTRPGRRRRRPRLQGRRGEPRQPDRDLRRGEGRGAQLALGRSAVLPAHRKAHGAAVLRGGHRVQAGAAPDVPRQRRQQRTQQAGHPVAAQGGHAPAHDRQRAWARRHSAASRCRWT